MTPLRFIITPLRSGLLRDHDNELDALVRVQAPGPPGSGPARKPLNLALVIDRSGSMSGRPLEEAKRCVRYIVDRLGSEDFVSLVAYDSHVATLVPRGRVGSRTGLHAAIASINSGGTTALYDGWLAGAGEAAGGVDGTAVSRILLLSDGQANVGLTDPDHIAAKCASMAEVGVTTSTYGLGVDFNEDLMVRMARAGQGNSYYGQTAEDLLDPFQEEFDLLQSLCARRLRLALEAPVGVGVDLLNRYEQDATGRWHLPDLAYGGEAWAAVRLRIPSTLVARAAGDEPIVLRAELTFEDLEGQSHRLESVTRLPWLTQEEYAAVATEPLVAERRQELHAADLLEEARAAARAGDWGGVDEILTRARREADANPWLQRSLGALQQFAVRRETENLAKEARYGSQKIRGRLADPMEEAGCYSVEMESRKPGFLRRKPEQGKALEGGPRP